MLIQAQVAVGGSEGGACSTLVEAPQAPDRPSPHQGTRLNSSEWWVWLNEASHIVPRRRSEALRAVLHRALNAHGMRLPRRIAPSVWESAVGRQIAARAQPTVLAGGTLHVLVQDHRWRDQLDAARVFLLERINRALGPYARGRLVEKALGQRLALDVPWDVFSSQRIDDGTLLLLKNLPQAEPRSVLDLGCGYGALGLPIAARRPSARCLLIDRDLL